MDFDKGINILWDQKHPKNADPGLVFHKVLNTLCYFDTKINVL